jgi:cyclic pyranopterin phosphate synthase
LLCDRYNRRIDYLRVAVTDRCNHRCVYCMPAAGVPLKPAAAILSYEQIAQVVRAATALGVRKVRLTGGEPLVRKGLAELVARLAPLPGLAELCLTTNGTQLAGLAPSLKAAGLGRVNISLASLDPRKYRAITRGGDLAAALAGVAAALAHGLTPVKINMVVLTDTQPDEVAAMRAFCETRGLRLQLINRFSLERRKHCANGGAERPPPCANCNRLRLTADGYLKPCLFSEGEIRVDFGDIRGALLAAAAGKPRNGTQCRNRPMPAIGG